MENFSKMIDGIGMMAEVSAIYYNSLVRAGLPESHAIALTAKVMGELMRSVISETPEEGKHE